MSEGFTPRPQVHRPTVFMCGEDPDDAVVTYREAPASEIAHLLLEDVGAWHSALMDLSETEIPPPVVKALGELFDAVCGWTDWSGRRNKEEKE